MALKKSRTFQGPANPPAPGEMFPTSPQLISGDGVVHWGHPKHPLVQLNVADLFTCSGCKECGAGKRFVCPHCDYQLHHFCANAPAALNSHPLHCHHTLVLFSKPAKGGGSKCELCHKACKGYAFRCNACVFQLHPCCATLGPVIRLAQLHPHTLRLEPTTAASPCAECGRKRLGWFYHCTVCDYHVHAVCAKSAVNGLRENGFKDQNPSKLNSAARIASQMMIGVIGSLIEGIAEGVGQVIAQDALKGRSTSASSSTSAAKRSSKNNNKNPV